MAAWQVTYTPSLAGQRNMEIDLNHFLQLEQGSNLYQLRIYSWQPQCISLGASQKIEEEIELEKAKAWGWDVVSRPTGGGIVFHNTAEVTYSLVMAKNDPLLPKGLVPAYQKISEALVLALKQLGVNAAIQSSPSEKSYSSLCFSYPAEYEVVVNGQKIVGSAQKRGRRALLQQGSIFVRQEHSNSLSLLKKKNYRYNAISLEELLGRMIDFPELSNALVKGFEEVLGLEDKV